MDLPEYSTKYKFLPKSTNPLLAERRCQYFEQGYACRLCASICIIYKWEQNGKKKKKKTFFCTECSRGMNDERWFLEHIYNK